MQCMQRPSRMHARVDRLLYTAVARFFFCSVLSILEHNRNTYSLRVLDTGGTRVWDDLIRLSSLQDYSFPPLFLHEPVARSTAAVL